MFVQKTWDRNLSSTCWARLGCRPVVIESGNWQLLGCFWMLLDAFDARIYLCKWMFTSRQMSLYNSISYTELVLLSPANWKVIHVQWLSNNPERQSVCSCRLLPRYCGYCCYRFLGWWYMTFQIPRFLGWSQWGLSWRIPWPVTWFEMFHSAWVKLIHVIPCEDSEVVSPA